MPNILSVSEATRAVKDVLEAEFPFLWVRGEITNLARPASGHLYFTLTDGAAALSVVWFKSAQWAPGQDDAEDCVNPLTGEVMDAGCASPELENGQDVLVAGRIGVYEPRGVYQLVAELVQPQGEGDLRMAFEALKRQLAEAGYFDESRKREIPWNPARVAVVTSPSGAAVRDFLRIAAERGTGAEIRIHPTLVQGGEAPGMIVRALRAADDGWAEAVALIRGGGSLEDLWAFNTREVADALLAMKTPVVCGVGHEPDVSIADYVADLRAATPSHAAQALWPRREEYMQRLDELSERLAGAGGRMLRGHEARLRELTRALGWVSPDRRLSRLQESFVSEYKRLMKALCNHLESAEADLLGQRERLGRAFGPRALERLGERLAASAAGLERAGRLHLEGASRRLELLEARLGPLDPELPLARGYALVRRADGRFLRSVAEVGPGDALRVQVRDGAVAARVEGVEPGEAQ
ncbi:MAG: exodeoxyribonuclease VII large subunit [Desulfovibrionaceae bacterium]